MTQPYKLTVTVTTAIGTFKGALCEPNEWQPLYDYVSELKETLRDDGFDTLELCEGTGPSATVHMLPSSLLEDAVFSFQITENDA